MNLSLRKASSRRTKALEAFFFFGGKKKHFSLDEKKKALFFFCVGFLVRRTCSHDFFDILVGVSPAARIFEF